MKNKIQELCLYVLLINDIVMTWVHCLLVGLCCLVLCSPLLSIIVQLWPFWPRKKLYWLFWERTMFQRKITHDLKTLNGKKIGQNLISHRVQRLYFSKIELTLIIFFSRFIGTCEYSLIMLHWMICKKEKTLHTK